MIRSLVFLGFIVTLLTSCNKENGEDGDLIFEYTFYTSYLKNTARYDIDNQLISTKEYFFDQKGKVISATYTSTLYPEYNSTSEFEYDDKGKVIAAYVNNELSRVIKWKNNIAEVFDDENQKISKFVFYNNRLIEVTTGYPSNNLRFRRLNYDSNDNIISVENDSEIFVEYLEYDTSNINPDYLLRSIGVLIDWKHTIFSENIFGVEKAYPYEGDDYSFPLTYYDYNYIFDSEGRVYELEDDKTAIYVFRFEYEQ